MQYLNIKIQKKYEHESNILIHSFNLFMLTKRILQLYNIHVSNEKIVHADKDYIDTTCYIRLCDDNKLQYLHKFSSVEHETFNIFWKCYEHKKQKKETKFEKSMKEMIDISKLLVNERLIETIHKEQLIFCVGKFDIKTLINGEIECTMGNKTYANKETIDNNKVFFKLSNTITWKSTNLKDDYNYNANDKYTKISKWLTLVLQESTPIDLTPQNYNQQDQKSSDDASALKNIKI